MLSRTHNLGAFASLITVTALLAPTGIRISTILVALVANIVGALIPDLDQASNRLWDMLPGGNFIGRYLRKIFISHRTLSHSIIGFILIYELNYWLIFRLFNPEFIDPNIVFYSLIIGFISHLVLDGLTEEGIPLLFPIRWKFGFPPIKSWRIKTGYWFENWVVFPSISLYIVWLFYTYSSVFLKLFS